MSFLNALLELLSSQVWVAAWNALLALFGVDTGAT
jgi:hypothetical protein